MTDALAETATNRLGTNPDITFLDKPPTYRVCCIISSIDHFT